MEAEGIPTVLAALRAHGKSDEGVAEHGCWALRNLAQKDCHSHQLWSLGAHEVVVDVLRVRGRSSARVAHKAIGLLWSMIVDRPDRLHVIEQAGGLAAARSACMMEFHTDGRLRQMSEILFEEVDKVTAMGIRDGKALSPMTLAHYLVLPSPSKN